MGKIRFGVGIFGSEPLPKIVAQVKLAEELGYDSAWLIDSQLICREVYVTLAACALNTSRIKLGTGVTLPYTRHASVTASAFATLNEIAPGRLLVGISIGNSAVLTLGVRRARIRELEEYVELLRGLLDGDTVPFEGGVEGKITWMESPSKIPIYVAASSPRLTRAAGRMADGAILLHGVSAPRLERAIELVKEGAGEAEKAKEATDIVCWVLTSLSPDGSLAREHIRGRVASILRMSDLKQFEEEDHPAILRLREAYDYYQHATAGSSHSTLVPEKFIDMFALAGTPDHVRERVKEVLRVPGFSQLVINTQVAGEGFPSVEAVMKDFAEGVMAHVA